MNVKDARVIRFTTNSSFKWNIGQGFTAA